MKVTVSKKTLIYLMVFYYILFTMTRNWIIDQFGSVTYFFFLFIGSLLILFFFINKKSRLQKNHIIYYACLTVYLILICGNLLFMNKASNYALFEYVFYTLLIFAFIYVLRHVQIEKIINFYEVIGAIIALEALWEFYSGKILYRESVDTQVLRRAYGLVGSPLTLAMLLACIVLMAIYMTVIKSKKHLIFVVIGITGLICTQSRGPLIALMVGCFVMYYYYQINAGVSGRNSIAVGIKTVFISIFSVICIIFILSILSKYNSLLYAVYSRIQTILSWGESSTANYQRISKWAEAINYFKEYPLFGMGVSTTGPHASTGIITESGVLKKLVEIGIVGFVIYYVMMTYGIFSNLKICKKRHSKYYPLAMAIIVSIFIENITLQIIESVIIVTILMIFLAYLFIQPNDNLVNEEHSSENISITRK